MVQRGRWLDGAFFLIYALLALAIVLELLGASPSAPLHRLVDAATAPFFAPFEALLHDPAPGVSRLVWSRLMALLGYSVLHVGVQGSVESLSPRPPRALAWRDRAR